MNVIYKYPLEHITRQTITMPENAKILTVQYQDDNLHIWALVDPEIQTTVKRKIAVIATGNPFNIFTRNLFYIGTVQKSVWVWHVFEILNA